jgi:hypothetical protein
VDQEWPVYRRSIPYTSSILLWLCFLLVPSPLAL